MTDPTAVALLRDAENYLSALHGSVARHDNLAANLACAGCELRDRIAAALPQLADAPLTERAALRDRIAEALREHYLCTNRDEADADGNMPCHCGDWREPGAEADDENDWDSHLADVALAVLPPPTARPTDGDAREQLLDALDFSYCQTLGYGTPEELLAAYDASRTVLPEPGGQAAVLLWAADQLAAQDPATAPLVGVHARSEDIALLRRLAAEAHGTGTQQPEAVDDEGDDLVCVDECGCCDACGMEPFGTPAEGWREAARFLRRTARASGDRAGALHGARLIEAELRRMADEAQQPDTETPAEPPLHGESVAHIAGCHDETPAAEDPARIDRLRPEFTEHASVESIDVQLRRARSQERRWHLRVEWLIGLRQARIGQKARGEWPAAGARQDGAQQCSAARLPFGRNPAEPCMVKGEHLEHVTADGFRWTVEERQS